jgi:predicted DNA-binding protein (UPF0251 family)
VARSLSVKSIVESPVSTSSKIRQLDQKGIKRGEIAKLLGIRYQFVRNVLERASAKAAKAESQG